MTKEIKLQEAKDYASNRGGVCLSINYTNNKEKLEWKCSNSEHSSWFANTDNVLRKKTWCLACSGKQKKSSEVGLKEAQNYAQTRLGQCLSTQYLSDEKKLEWKCSNAEHSSWFAFPKIRLTNSWCKECYDERRKK